MKERSKQWTERGESAPKKTKTIPSAGTAMVSVFGMCVAINHIQKENTINGV